MSPGELTAISVVFLEVLGILCNYSHGYPHNDVYRGKPPFLSYDSYVPRRVGGSPGV